MTTRVLLVDDEEAFVDALSKRLTQRGFEVSVAYNGQQAVDSIPKEHMPDVVILDVKMPGMDGIQTLQVIKSKWPLIEVIMLTAFGTVESAIDGLHKGALDYLLKPCAIEIIVEKIKDAKSKKSAQEMKIAEARALSIALRRGD